MLKGSLSGFIGRMALNCIEYSIMLIEQFLNFCSILKNPCHGFPEKIIDRGHHVGLDGVMGCLSNAQMEVGILLFPELSLLKGFPHLFDDSLQLFYIFFCSPLGSMKSAPGLYSFSYFNQVEDLLGICLEEQGEGILHTLRCHRFDEGPFSLYFQKSHANQGVQGFTERRTAHSKFLDELSFGRKGIPRLSCSLADETFHLIDNLIRNFDVFDGLKHII